MNDKNTPGTWAHLIENEMPTSPKPMKTWAGFIGAALGYGEPDHGF